MKKIFITLLVFFTFLSCTNNDSNEEIITPLLQKVILRPDTTSEHHWNFNQNGLLETITKADGTILQTFLYDARNNLINNTIYNYNPSYSTVHAFTYTNNNIISSYNSIPVIYDITTNTYTVDFINNPNDIDYLDRIEIVLNNQMLITSEKAFYIDIITGNYWRQGILAGTNNNNMMGNSQNNSPSYNTYQFDAKINPFKLALLPICKAMCLTNFNDIQSKWAAGEFNSINNVIANDYSLIETESYLYEYNSNNLPTKKTTFYYNTGVLESTSTSMLYYYQGDIIPN